MPSSATWIAFVKARHSMEDPSITNAMSALSQKTIVAHPINVRLYSQHRASLYAHTALGGRNLTTATKVIRIKMANTTNSATAKITQPKIPTPKAGVKPWMGTRSRS